MKKIISTYNKKIAAFRNARRELSKFNEDLIFKSFGE